MRMFDVQGIEIMAPRHKVFEFLREPGNLPRWAHAFVSAGRRPRPARDARGSGRYWLWRFQRMPRRAPWTGGSRSPTAASGSHSHG